MQRKATTVYGNSAPNRGSTVGPQDGTNSQWFRYKACGGCFRNLKEAHYSTANFITLMFLVLRLYSILLEQSKKPREWAGYNLFARLDQGQVWTLLLGQGLHLVVNHC